MSGSDDRTSGIESQTQRFGFQPGVGHENGKQTKEQFLDQLVCLHQRISTLNLSGPQREAIETNLSGIAQGLDSLLAVSPAGQAGRTGCAERTGRTSGNQALSRANAP